MIKPSVKAILQDTSPLAGLKRPPTMPVIPAIRPFSNMNSAADIPMSAPPASADQGVKLFQSIIIINCIDINKKKPHTLCERPYWVDYNLN
jgi:hypothetical protein